MSKDGPTPEKNSFLAGPFTAITRLILAFPRATVAIGIALAIAAVVLSTAKLGYRTSRLDLLNPKSEYNQLWIKYIEEFGEDDDAVIVVEGASREQVVPVLDELSKNLSRDEKLFHSVLHEVNLRNIRSKGLHYLSPEELLQIDQFLNETGPIIEGDWSRLGLGKLFGGVTAQMANAGAPPTPAAAEQMQHRLSRLCDSLDETVTQHKPYQSPWPEMPRAFSMLSELNSEYLLAQEGRLGFVLLRLKPSEGSFERSGEAIDRLRELIADSRGRNPEVTIGLTGLPVMESDEMQASQDSMISASVVSMIGVAILFVAGFGGIRHALLANVVLLVGMAWAFGYATLAVGHLNILSVTFTVTLIGIGIDYGVYYVARYLQIRREGHDTYSALMQTSRGAGPAILTGAMTTAISFFAAGLTNFTGVAELGIIAGGGILLCAVAQLGILPASLYLVDRSSLGTRMPTPLRADKWIDFTTRLPRMTVAACVTATLALALGLPKVWYDNNLLNMQAVGLESVELERRLLSECNQSVWYALSISDSRDELLARKAQFLKLPSVERTEEIVSMLPVDHEIKRPIIERIQQRLAALPERPPLIPVERPERLGQVLGGVQMMLERVGADPRTAAQLEGIRDMLRRMPLADCYATLSRFQQEMAGDLLNRLFLLKSVANPEPPQLSDLPESLVHRFVGNHGRYLLKIYGRGNIWDTKSLSSFVSDVRTVDSQVTGNPIQAHEASLEMKQSYQQAALYSFLVILGVLWFELRNWRYCLLAALPLGIGLLQTFGLLGLLDMPLNPANLIALPLILGIGIDYGIHIVHEFREQHGPYRMTSGTAIAVVVDGLTTIVGFGSLMIASHQGLQSLGRVLTLGITCCMLSSMILLPALLRLLTRNRLANMEVDAPPLTSPRPAVVPGLNRAAA